MDYSELDKHRRSAVPLQLDTIEAFAAGRLSRREFMQRAAILGLSMGAISAIVAACGGTPASAGASAAASAGASAAGSAAASAAGSAAVGGTMRIAAQKPVKVDPVAMQDLGGYGITSQSFEFLCALTPDNLVSIGPGLALKWTPKMRNAIPSGTISRKACRDTRGRCHS